MPRSAIAPIEQLRMFVARVEELRDTRLIRAGFNPGYTITWDKMKGLRFESREPDEEDLRSFLLTFRQFVAEKEPIFLLRIHNLAQKHITSSQLRGYLAESREAWQEAYKSIGIRLIFNDREITPEHVMDLWINGYYFHNDYEKARGLKNLLPHERLIVRHHFLSFLVEATRQILYVGNVVKAALREGLVLNSRY